METDRELIWMDMGKFQMFELKERFETVCRTWVQEYLYSRMTVQTMDFEA